MEFEITGAMLIEEAGSRTTRGYEFRATDSATMAMWMDAIRAHIQGEAEEEAQRVKRQKSTPQQPEPELRKEALPSGFDLRKLSGTLMKKSPTFPYPWQKREVSVSSDGSSLMYKSGNGAQKGISLLEVTAICVTDPNSCEFEIKTQNKNYRFRGVDKAASFSWVRGLQELHSSLAKP